MMAPKGTEIDIAIFISIILTDFVTFNPLNSRPDFRPNMVGFYSRKA